MNYINNLNTRSKIIGGMILPVIVLLVLGFLIYKNINTLIESEDNVQYTHEALQDAVNISHAAVDMETGMRGYLLTGRDEYLVPYRNGEENIYAYLSALKTKVRDDPPQVELLIRVTDLVQEWQQQVAQPNIALRQQVGKSKDMNDMGDLIVAAGGKVYIDNFRIQITAFLNTERDLLVKRSQAVEANQNSASNTVTDALVVHTFRVLESAHGLFLHAINMETGMRGFLLSGEEEFLEPYNQGRSLFYDHVEELAETVKDNPPQVKLLTAIRDTVQRWEEKVAQPNIALRREISLGTSMDDIARKVGDALGKTYFDQIRILLIRFKDEENRLMSLGKLAVRDQVKNSYQSVVLMFGLALLIGGLSAWYISTNIALPLRRATQAMGRIAKGEEGVQLQDTDRSDEIGILNRGFNRMMLRLVEQDNLMKIEIDDRRAAESQANASNAAKSHFLSSMSHEIRTPLNGVLGMAQLLLKSELSSKQKTTVTTILSSGYALLNILNDVLDMSKIETGNIELESFPFDFCDLLTSFSQTYEHLCQDSLVDFIMAMEMGDLSVIKGDQMRLQQILTNLINNAFKFTSNGHISLKASNLTQNDPDFISGADHSIRIVISDTGRGIAADRLSSIFDTFSQEDASISRQYGGSGLGLSIVQKFCTLMGGSISVESIQTVGTQFTLLFPFEKVTEDDLKSMVKDADTISNLDTMPMLNILVAEDNVINTMIIREFLELMGHNVDVAINGQLALDAVKARDDLDAIFMDIHMPVMDGIEATKRIRELPDKRHIPIIGLTAEAFIDRIQYFKEIGMVEVISKPFREKELITVLMESVVKELSGENSQVTSLEKTTVPLHQTLPIGDSEALIRLMNGFSSKKREELFKKSETSLNALMTDLRTGIETSNSDMIEMSAHTIKGSSGSLFATRMSSLASQVEGVSVDLKKVKKLMPHLEDTSVKTIEWWRHFHSQPKY